ncbi:MAG: hypothetical protein ABI144_07190 [Gallionella sp.]
MDNKTIFVRTKKGEEQVQSRTSHLSGDIKRALSMVDGSATFGEISKRSAPSMRANLAEMFDELEKTGLIQDKSFAGKIPKTAMPPKMVVPVKMATPQKNSAAGKDSDELDFLSGYPSSPRQVSSAEAVEKSKREIEARKIKAQQEAEAAHRKAEEQVRLKLEAAAREQREAEAARTKAEQEARRVREELEAAKLKAEQEARLRIEAAEREQKEAEAAKLKAEQEARRVREELEAAKLKAEQEAKQRLEAAERERKEADVARLKAEQEAARVKAEREAARVKAEQEAAHIKAEQEAARIKTEQEAARVKAEQEAAQMQVELELAKRRQELEAQARIEAQARADARKKAEEDAEQDRVAAEHSARQAHEEAAHANEEIHAPISETDEAPGEKPDRFSFDAFQVDESPQSEEQEKKPGQQHKTEPVQKSGPAESAPAAVKQDAFSFDSFNVDEPAAQPEPKKSKSSGETAKSPKPADAPADVRELAKNNVPLPAASPTARQKPDKEELKRQEQERIAAQQRVAEEAKAREMADAQAKVWAEAEQRAEDTARAHAEQVARQAERKPETGHAGKPVHVARVPRKTFAWGKLVGFVVKLGIFLLVLLIGALFVVPYVLPMRDYMPKVQQMLADRLHQPVHLGYMSGRILPTPRLDLGEIYIGDAKQFQAATAQINFDMMGVFGDSKPIDSVDFDDVKIRGIALKNAAAWLQQLAADKQYPVSRIAITQGTLDADVFQLTGVEGELNFSSAGKFTRAKLNANSGKYSLGIEATPNNTLLATLTVRGSALPLLPNWKFDELDAKGEITSDGFLINQFETKILGGNVQGNARIDWRSGWHAEGVLNAKNLAMNGFNKLLDGNIDGTAHFRMNSKELAGLTDSSELEGSFTSTNGLISGLDIVETARMRSKENLPGGRTHYDGFRGNFRFANDVYHFSQVKIDAGVLKADATFDISKQQLSGKMKVNLSMNDGITSDLQLGGAIDNPTLVYVP